MGSGNWRVERAHVVKRGGADCGRIFGLPWSKIEQGVEIGNGRSAKWRAA